MLTWGSLSGGGAVWRKILAVGCESCNFSSLQYTLKLGIGPWQICQGWATYFFGLTHIAIPPPSLTAARYLPRAIPRHGSRAGSTFFLYSRATVNNISWKKSFKMKTLFSVCGVNDQHLFNISLTQFTKVNYELEWRMLVVWKLYMHFVYSRANVRLISQQSVKEASLVQYTSLDCEFGLFGLAFWLLTLLTTLATPLLTQFELGLLSFQFQVSDSDWQVFGKTSLTYNLWVVQHIPHRVSACECHQIPYRLVLFGSLV